MNDLAQATAVLESVNLAHGDLRPESVLPDRNRLKLSNFDCRQKLAQITKLSWLRMAECSMITSRIKIFQRSGALLSMLHLVG
jgi:hypothetical protein